MKTIPIYGTNLVALVDDEDYERLVIHKWYLHGDGYALRTGREGQKRRSVLMHREITGWPETHDHIDKNPLNNQKSNLRICNASQNQGNRSKQEGTSQYKGVTWSKRFNRWQAGIRMNAKRKHLGYFTDETAAARVYDAAAVRYFGEFAATNRSLGLLQEGA